MNESAMTEPRIRPSSNESTIARDDSVSLLWLLALLVRDRRVILWCSVAGLLLGLAIALLRPKSYTTTFSFIPQSSPDASRASLAGLAQQFGMSLGDLGGAMQSPQLYADLLVTRAVLGPVATDSFAVGPDSTVRVPLAEFLDVGGDEPPVRVEKTLRVLRRNVIATSLVMRTGMVTARVRTRSPYVSLQIAERLLQGLNHFNLITRQSQAREEVRFTEGRLEDARASLRAAEDVLQRFLQVNREFAESPALVFQRDRLQREVLLRQQVVTSLAQRYEENRIREVRDTPVITMIDTPALAARPDRRLVPLILLLGLAAGFAVGALIVISRDGLTSDRTTGRDPALAVLSSEWKRIRGVASS
jgi:uncharacterized protein involved in exopolysaccharide biosynthesis